LNLYSTLPYFGAFIGYIIISYYADNKGRKNITILGWAVSIIGVIMVVAAPNITVASIGMFLAGLGTDSGTNISMIFMV
jgi:MFS family permease